MAYKQFSTIITKSHLHALKNNTSLTNSFYKCMSSSAAANKSLNVGFVGLGNMGARMANNLIKKGHKLNAFDVEPAACKEAERIGCKIVDSAEQVAQKSDFVVTMLPNNDIVFDTYDKMVKNGVKSSTMFIDSSTIDPNVAKKVQQLVKTKGASFVDAPVSGGVIGAENATLTFMVGGTQDEYKTVKGLLECMGQRITHCGDYGMGQAAKICNNMMLGISMIGVCETMNLAIRLGLDPKTFNDIINSSTGKCWSSEIYNPVPGLCANAPANNDYKGGFSTALITKDLGLASGVATASNSPIPMGAIAHQIYRTLMCRGLGDKDFSYVYEFLKNNNQK
ncbi:probable 3-hydroxyisobutyrate dehydrogenase, mitochondrial [Sitodiplosis mosellana]|uniref:probable 3-hydroxyisobutyrate dehydrogenase, mitochondrial n=1 Tax=Sitodiplosis mosellana TaxID=263140 RepID=UPI002444C8BC|nr:probable 3-hydroxyisobutyrate dehydrogenase, mitochondrial [Sitodiplosis mosellana]